VYSTGALTAGCLLPVWQVDPQTGHNRWIRGTKTNQTYLLLMDAKKAGETLDALL
jgi:hypothetical protein